MKCFCASPNNKPRDKLKYSRNTDCLNLCHNIKPSKQFHPIPSPRACSSLPTLLVPFLACPLISTIFSAYNPTLPRSKVRLTLTLALFPPLSPVLPPVRKAYKKRALQTHPDRVPPEQKTTAEEDFRKVPRVLTSPLPCSTHSRPARLTMHTKFLSIPLSAG